MFNFLFKTTNPTVDSAIAQIDAALDSLEAVIADEKAKLNRVNADIVAETGNHNAVIKSLNEEFNAKMYAETERHGVVRTGLSLAGANHAANITKGEDFVNQVRAALTPIAPDSANSAPVAE